MRASILKVSSILAGLYLVFLGLLAGCQRHLIYFPHTEDEAALMQRAITLGLEPWPDESGERIGWKSIQTTPSEQERVVLIFHGNAGHALHRLYFVDGFRALPGEPAWTVYLFEYPGYGGRRGTPGADAFKASGERAVRLLAATQPGNLLILEESIGTGVAAYLAGRMPETIDGLILITPFSSLKDVAAHHYPFLPVDLLLRENYDNIAALQTYRGPLAVILAADDEVIPARYGEKLYQSYSGPKHLWTQPNRGHNTLDYTPHAPWWREMAAFFEASDAFAE